MIEAHLKKFSTLNELNKNLSQSIDITSLSHRKEHSRVTGVSPTDSEQLDTGGSRDTKSMKGGSMRSPDGKTNNGTSNKKKESINIIPLTRAYFERFFNIKQAIFDKEQALKIKE